MDFETGDSATAAVAGVARGWTNALVALLLKVMNDDNAFQGCIEQVDSLFRDSLYGASPKFDDEGRLRADGWELQPEIQQRVEQMWADTTTENLNEVSDFAGYKRGFLQLFGFEVDGVDYEQDVNPVVPIAGMV